MPRTEWYAVRCLFKMNNLAESYTYEERITLWLAESAEEATDKAEAEAVDNAEGIGMYLGFAQSFHLFGEPREGAEAFSLMRDSHLDSDDYLSRFFSSGTEREGRYGE